MLRYDYNSVIGTAIFSNGKCTQEVTIYGGNCFAIMVYEEKSLCSDEIVEKLYAYFNDEEHLERALGVGKGYENNYFYGTDLTSFRLNMAHPDTPKFAKCLAQAKWQNGITIELVNWNTETNK